MDALNLLLAAALASPAPPGVAPWRNEIAAASTRCGIPAAWIARVMRAESAGMTMLKGRPIRSTKGAIGLMQLMPDTWAELRGQLGLGRDPDHPADNIVAGSCYLRRMYDRFGYPGLFAAYNAGPGRYAAHLREGTPLPAETVAYLRTVSAGSGAAPALPAPHPPASLFVVHRDRAEGSLGEGSAASDSLFAVRAQHD